MVLKFNKLSNNCYFLEFGNKILLISYESIISCIDNNILYINENFLNYSKTTSKHLNLLKENLKHNFNSELILSNKDFYKLVNQY